MLFIIRTVIIGLFSLAAINLFVFQGIEFMHAITDLFNRQDSPFLHHICRLSVHGVRLLKQRLFAYGDLPASGALRTNEGSQ